MSLLRTNLVASLRAPKTLFSGRCLVSFPDASPLGCYNKRTYSLSSSIPTLIPTEDSVANDTQSAVETTELDLPAPTLDPLRRSKDLLANLRCFQCGEFGHKGKYCSKERLCLNCLQPGHISSACPSPHDNVTKICYRCGGTGHIQSECPQLKCYKCGGQGHFARACPSPISSPSPYSPKTVTSPRIKCYRCGGYNHISKYCMAHLKIHHVKVCHRCHQEGHDAKDCSELRDPVGDRDNGNPAKDGSIND